MVLFLYFFEKKKYLFLGSWETLYTIYKCVANMELLNNNRNHTENIIMYRRGTDNTARVYNEEWERTEI